MVSHRTPVSKDIKRHLLRFFLGRFYRYISLKFYIIQKECGPFRILIGSSHPGKTTADIRKVLIHQINGIFLPAVRKLYRAGFYLSGIRIDTLDSPNLNFLDYLSPFLPSGPEGKLGHSG